MVWTNSQAGYVKSPLTNAARANNPKKIRKVRMIVFLTESQVRFSAETPRL
jgi:hypothetical protein